MTWITIRLKTTTPLFNQGFDQADTTGIRVPSIRGAMRFWLRAMLGAVLGDDLDALRQWESRVLGRATTPNDHASSPLQMRIAQQPSIVKAGTPPDWLPSHGRKASQQGHDRWLVYLAGRELADARTCTLLRHHVPPDQPIELKLRMRRTDHDALSLALGALWLTCSFGGVGARTRRGFGGLRIVDAAWGDAERLPRDEDLLATSIDPQTLGQDSLWPTPIVSLLGGLRGSEDYHRWPSLPPYPVLGPPTHPPDITPTTAAASQGHYNSWSDALTVAGSEWRRFRATSDGAPLREGATEPYHPYVRTPEWIDVVSPRLAQPTTGGTEAPSLGLGALGLPIVFREKVHVGLFLNGVEHRRASPLWIRPIRDGRKWRILTTGFRSQLLPDQAIAQPTLVIDEDKTPVTITNDDLLDKVQAWTQRIKRCTAQPHET